MLPILQVGPFALQLPGLILLAGLWLGINLAERYADRFGVKASELSKLIMLSLLAALLGARLVYALRYLEVFLASPLSLLSLNPGLLDSLGGLACAILVGWIYTQRKKLPLWGTLDALTPAAAVMAIFLALAHLASGAAFGAETNLPWALELWGATRHPSQIYEALAAALILLVCWPGRKTWHESPPGTYFLSFVALSAGARLFLEAFRGDSLTWLWGLRTNQIIAWLVLAISLWGIAVRRNKSPHPDTATTEEPYQLDATKGD